jgi:2-phosphoglycerate kinase
MRPGDGAPVALGDPDGPPYSKGVMARSLVAAGVGIEPAYLLADRLGLELAASGAQALEPERLREAACELLGEDEGTRVVERLYRLEALGSLDLPLVLLVGGGTGTGKSTVATEAAHRLGVTRLTSTDFIRQTIRAYFPAAQMPSVHVSSFEADVGEGLEAGFLDQTRRVLVGVEAAIERALTEGWSMAIEGVHLVPGMVPAEIDGALLVHAVLQVSDVEEHRGHFVVRDAHTGGLRPLQKYLDELEGIRRLQDLIVDRARRHAVPVLESRRSADTAGALVDLVLERCERLAAPLERLGSRS